MTIDKAIANERKIIEKCKTEYELECARYGKRTVESFGKLECIKIAEEHEQRSKWFEELKEARNCMEENRKAGYNHGFTDGFNKAIDDFIKTCDKKCGFYTGMNKQLTRDMLLEIAEQLKEGVRNGTDNQ